MPYLTVDADRSDRQRAAPAAGSATHARASAEPFGAGTPDPGRVPFTMAFRASNLLYVWCVF